MRKILITTIFKFGDLDDGEVIDTRDNIIVNRSLDGAVPRKVQKQILDTPDYFEYIVTEVKACQ